MIKHEGSGFPWYICRSFIRGWSPPGRMQSAHFCENSKLKLPLHPGVGNFCYPLKRQPAKCYKTPTHKFLHILIFPTNHYNSCLYKYIFIIFIYKYIDILYQYFKFQICIYVYIVIYIYTCSVHITNLFWWAWTNKKTFHQFSSCGDFQIPLRSSTAAGEGPPIRGLYQTKRGVSSCDSEKIMGILAARPKATPPRNKG